MSDTTRSRDSDGPDSRGSREREEHRSEERLDRGAERDDRRGGDRNGEYNGPAGMQPEGLIEVCIPSVYYFQFIVFMFSFFLNYTNVWLFFVLMENGGLTFLGMQLFHCKTSEWNLIKIMTSIKGVHDKFVLSSVNLNF